MLRKRLIENSFVHGLPKKSKITVVGGGLAKYVLGLRRIYPQLKPEKDTFTFLKTLKNPMLCARLLDKFGVEGLWGVTDVIGIKTFGNLVNIA